MTRLCHIYLDDHSGVYRARTGASERHINRLRCRLHPRELALLPCGLTGMGDPTGVGEQKTNDATTDSAPSDLANAVGAMDLSVSALDISDAKEGKGDGDAPDATRSKRAGKDKAAAPSNPKSEFHKKIPSGQVTDAFVWVPEKNVHVIGAPMGDDMLLDYTYGSKENLLLYQLCQVHQQHGHPGMDDHIFICNERLHSDGSMLVIQYLTVEHSIMQQIQETHAVLESYTFQPVGRSNVSVTDLDAGTEKLLTVTAEEFGKSQSLYERVTKQKLERRRTQPPRPVPVMVRNRPAPSSHGQPRPAPSSNGPPRPAPSSNHGASSAAAQVEMVIAAAEAQAEAEKANNAEAEHATAPGEGKNAASNRKKREKAAAKKREASESGDAEEPADVASQDPFLQEPQEPVEETANVIPPMGASTRRTR